MLLFAAESLHSGVGRDSSSSSQSLPPCARTCSRAWHTVGTQSVVREGGREQRGGAPEPYSELVGRAATILLGVFKATTAHGGSVTGPEWT